MNNYYKIVMKNNTLSHHGIDGQRWGVRNGPPYPLSSSRIHYKTGDMEPAEYNLACSLWNKYREAGGLSIKEKEYVYEELDNNLTADEKTYAIVSRRIDDVLYTAINKGHNQYKIIKKQRLGGRSTWDEMLDDILTAVVGKDWRDYDD